MPTAARAIRIASTNCSSSGVISAQGTRVLEIGPGSGQATIELLRRGAVVDAFELGAELAGSCEPGARRTG